ncbi:Methyltransferase domain-containing protein [Natronincola peptidivorans]|uniref:Methyltransferase domain-containing protein n=1 Tax=Natronincola peptidivorans TaxID=426128 RepID=A0A1I0H9E3_9FIRM|nr:class I SAM-dependent methyltransferase [Natronincola peptidivorans]SET79459.1 Methyltransferase domain-containing protein [Natronincola peptidivorans]
MDSKSYFNDVANQWDTMRKDFFAEEIREKAFEVADIHLGKLAADIGAGTGFITEGLLLKGLQVIAVDQSEAMIKKMKSKFGDSKLVDYREGTAESIPIEKNTVDYIFANMYLHHVEEPLIAIKEMARVLKPGGKMVITDLDQHNNTFLQEEQYDRWMGFKREDIKTWFQTAGLRNVYVNGAGGNCCAASNSGCEEASVSIFVAYGEK